MKFNKAAACLIATACTVSVFGAMTTASAATSLSINAGSATAKAGETFTVDIELAGVPSSGVAGLDFAIKYDSSVMKVTGVKEGSVSKTTDKQVEGFTSNLNTNISTGAVSVLWATGQIQTNASWIKSDGVLLTLECEALKDGTSKIEITKGTRADATSVDAAVEGLEVVNPSVTAGTVTVGSTAAASPSPTGTTTGVVLGDVDCDGKVDITDLSTLAVALVDKTGLSAEASKNADVNGDGTVALTDLAKLKQFISKQIDKL